jgi:hypothetical protein
MERLFLGPFRPGLVFIRMLSEIFNWHVAVILFD